LYNFGLLQSSFVNCSNTWETQSCHFLLDYVACNFDIWLLSSAYLVITTFDLLLTTYPLQVLYYLFRVEPFTTLSIQLQGSKFDHADRMFSDLSGTWDSVLEDMSDVKEHVFIVVFMLNM